MLKMLEQRNKNTTHVNHEPEIMNPRHEGTGIDISVLEFLGKEKWMARNKYLKR